MKRREFIVNTALLALVAGIGLNACDLDTVDTARLKKANARPDKKKLLFLLRRATLGFTAQQFEELKKLTLDEIIEKLLNEAPKTSVPLNFEFANDLLVPIGETWINAPYRNDIFYEQYRKKSLRAWLMSTNLENTCSLRQQMLFFWLNFYSISDVTEHKYEYRHIKYFQSNPWGSFRQITKDIAIDPAMLKFLSGSENKKDNPNENFSRELLELFTVGRGETAGKGDYTTFTEKDVSELSKVFTGWKDVGEYNLDPAVKVGVKFYDGNHDESRKQLSHRFQNKTIDGAGIHEYEKVINLIFEKKETAVHFTKRLYKWFCCEEITAETEQAVILPLSKLLIENNYEVKPVLAALLSSEHFYSLMDNSARLKNPVQYTFDLLNFFPLSVPKNVPVCYSFYSWIHETIAKMGMELLKPPSVAGWKAYYQAPAYSRLWINAASLQGKKNLVSNMSQVDKEWTELGVNVDYAALVKKSGVASPEELIAYLNFFFFNDVLNAEISGHLQKLLTSGFDTVSGKEIIEGINAGNENLLKNLRTMTGYLFNLPMLNIH